MRHLLSRLRRSKMPINSSRSALVNASLTRGRSKRCGIGRCASLAFVLLTHLTLSGVLHVRSQFSTRAPLHFAESAHEGTRIEHRSPWSVPSRVVPPHSQIRLIRPSAMTDTRSYPDERWKGAKTRAPPHHLNTCRNNMRTEARGPASLPEGAPCAGFQIPLQYAS